MSLVSMNPLLRRSLQADGLISAVAGLIMTLGSGLLADLLQLPATFLLSVGLVLFPWAACLLWMASKPAVPRAAVWTVIAINAVWVIDSAWVSMGGSFQPSLLGHAFIAAQALGVVVLAELEFMGLRRSASAPTPVSALSSRA